MSSYLKNEKLGIDAPYAPNGTRFRLKKIYHYGVAVSLMFLKSLLFLVLK